jgi:hypothetical protein
MMRMKQTCQPNTIKVRIWMEQQRMKMNKYRLVGKPFHTCYFIEIDRRLTLVQDDKTQLDRGGSVRFRLFVHVILQALIQ